MILTAQLAPPAHHELTQRQTDEDYGMVALGAWPSDIIGREQAVHPDDAGHLQGRLNNLCTSVGVLVADLHDANGNALHPQAGDFRVDDGQLELHGILLDDATRFTTSPDRLAGATDAYRVYGHLITEEDGIYRHTGIHGYTNDGRLVASKDTLQNLTPDRTIGTLGFLAFQQLQTVVEKGERAAIDLGNRYGIVTPTHEAYDLSGAPAV